MRYTQLAYSAWEMQKKPLFEQAQSLLHDLIKERSHNHPCECGACIYAASRAGAKAEGRSFSKRTCFVFFLQRDFLQIVFLDKRLQRKDRIMKASKDRNEAVFKYKDYEDVYGDRIVLHTEIYFNRVKEITRRRVLNMIKRLEEKERGWRARQFINGILNKKCFYTYYKRAEDPRLYSIVQKIRRELLPGAYQFSDQKDSGLIIGGSADPFDDPFIENIPEDKLNEILKKK